MTQHVLPPPSRYGRCLAIAAIELVVVAALIVGLAFAWDEGLEAWRGNPPWMVCKVAGWLPWRSVPTIAAGVGIAGVMLFVASQRVLGFALIVIALMGYFLPDVFMPSWLTSRCPWLPFAE